MTPSPANAAFVYVSDNYDTSGPTLVGRQAASEGFLRGFVRHAGVDTFYCYAHVREAYDDFVRRVEDFAGRPKPTQWITPDAADDLAHVGTIFRPGPDIGQPAWLRRRRGQRSASLCGVTHTTADHLAMDVLGGLMTAPLQKWDALVCTSAAVREMVDTLLDGWGEYLGRRFGTGPPTRPWRLPVIPLGVDCDAFADSAGARQARAAIRDRHGIGEDDVVVLYTGRLTHVDKANPLPLYLGVEAAAVETGKPLHLIQAGWFPAPYVEEGFRTAAATFAPSVHAVFVDGRNPEVRATIRFAADIFASFPDNIQETFGLTPIEAMAAGLPVVVSDWNGYRDTVRDGIDGIMVPTVMPPPGVGLDIAYWFASGMSGYEGYTAGTGQSIAVDVEAAASAFIRLAGDAALRRRMGDAGRIRARETFDWRVVIRAYQDLWSELADERRRAPELVPPVEDEAFYPLRADPFRLFLGYPTRTLDADTRITLGSGVDPDRLRSVRESPIAHMLPGLLLPEHDVDRLLGRLAGGDMRVGDLLRDVGEDRHADAYRTVGWLAKTGLVRLTD